MTSDPGHRGEPRRALYAAPLVVALVVAVVLAGTLLVRHRTEEISGGADGDRPGAPGPSAPGPSGTDGTGGTSTGGTGGSGGGSGPTPARIGATASSQRIRFEPRTLVLDGASAPVQPASTVEQQLQVPEEVQHLGWWDGSAAVGDPFGNVVVAGHIDSATEGLGFFARLPDVAVGDLVRVQGRAAGATYALDYRVRRIDRVDKDALATDSAAFDQQGSPHLVLITCTGAYLPDSGGYQQNLVVTATPVGQPRRQR